MLSVTVVDFVVVVAELVTVVSTTTNDNPTGTRCRSSINSSPLPHPAQMLPAPSAASYRRIIAQWLGGRGDGVKELESFRIL